MKRTKHVKMNKRVFLEGVKQRLVDDVGLYFHCIDEKMQEELLRTQNPLNVRVIGFWALVRMIFPPITATAVVLYRSKKKKKQEKEREVFSRLLRKLSIKYPAIIIEVYRHSLMHGDIVRGISLKKYEIQWSMSLHSSTHFFHKHQVNIDLKKLYDDFLAFLDIEIQKSGNKTVWVENQVAYAGKIPTDLFAELNGIRLEQD